MCQLSYYEAFGLAPLEGMGCGCVPVVTNRGALPEVVGDAGVVVEYGNIEDIVNGIKKALVMSEDRTIRKRAVERVKNFTLEKREKHLIKIIKQLIFY